MPRTTDAILADLQSAGYYPQLVANVLDLALAGEQAESHLVHAETTFDSEVRRHLTTLVLTPSRLVVAHVDDALDPEGVDGALATTDSVSIDAVRVVSLTFGVTKPASNTSPSEVNLALSWGGANRIELEPAQCADPECTNDHGMTGRTVTEDVLVRVSATADGQDKLDQALTFARAMMRATSGRR